MHKAFFGDRDREFSITPHLIPELQAKTGKGIVALIADFRRAGYSDIVETIRLGLIGGGEAPAEALRLVSTYVPIRPLSEAHLLALDILTDLWIGPEKPIVGEAAEKEKASTKQRKNSAATGDLSAAINGAA